MEGRMADKTWKAVERCLAKRLGGQRVGATGHSTADVLTDWLAVEVKTRKVLPGWLLSAVEQAVGAAGEEQLPIVILHQVGGYHSDDLVVMLLRDFEQWFGTGKGEEE